MGYRCSYCFFAHLFCLYVFYASFIVKRRIVGSLKVFRSVDYIFVGLFLLFIIIGCIFAVIISFKFLLSLFHAVRISCLLSLKDLSVKRYSIQRLSFLIYANFKRLFKKKQISRRRNSMIETETKTEIVKKALYTKGSEIGWIGGRVKLIRTANGKFVLIAHNYSLANLIKNS